MADIFVKMIRLRRYSVVVIFFCLFSSSRVVVALLGLLGGRIEVGRVGRHGELFLDAGGGRGTSDSAVKIIRLGFWEDIPFVVIFFCFVYFVAGSPNARMGSTLT